MGFDEIYEKPWFEKFAASLKPLFDLNQFTRINSDTISWTKQGKYEGPHVCVFIKCEFNTDVNGEQYPMFIMTMTLGNEDSGLRFYGVSPDGCINVLNQYIEFARDGRKKMDEVWSKYGF